LRSVGRNVVPAGERVVLEFPGGAGYGDPAERDPAAVAAERQAGLVS
jgi:N-methylhydantoinase B